MIIFKKVRWKNFLSTGNFYNEIDLYRNRNTLIIGNNGSGKSTMLDALSFGLFGKPYRNINKPQLINTINNKDCVVEVEFSIGPNTFKVVRGIKQTIFEIWKNDELFNESSHSKEFQKMLEQNILKLNHKSFHQIVVLGSSSFVPFMQLAAHQRREVIEDLLDINVFSKMNVLVKEEIANIKNKISDKGHELDLVRTKIDVQRKYISDIKTLNQEKIYEKQVEITSQENTIEQIDLENEEIQETLKTTYDQTEESLRRATDSLNDARGQAPGLKKQLSTLVKESKFFDENDVCPTCTQQITESIKHEKKQEITEKAKEVQMSYQEVTKQVETSQELVNELTKKFKKQTELNNKISENNLKISWARKAISKLEKEIASMSGTKANLKEANNDLEELIDQKDSLLTEKIE